ncbi:MAG TPA: hypothetical protein VNO20_10970 [Solirubrobacterales bacterium]|nr:hypothetical protein [Solirubrobacterales bacterium]
MKRIRKLGLAAVMALALSATVGATSASAATLTADLYPAAVEGQGYNHVFQTGSHQFVCAEPPGFAMEVGAPTNTVTTWSGSYSCTSKLYGSSTLEMNGCAYSLHSGAGSNATFEVGPPGCGPMKLNGATCDLSISAQGGLTGSSLINEVNGESSSDDSVLARADALLAASETGGCAGLTINHLVYGGTWELEGSVGGAPVGLRIQQPGVYTGKGGFEAENYPTVLSGNQDSGNTHVLTIGSRAVYCAEASFFSDELAGPSSSLAFDAEYGGCWTKPVLGVVFPALILMNSCKWTLDTGGSMGVGCTEAGDGAEVIIYADKAMSKVLCVATYKSQAGVTEVKYATVGEGSGRGISVGLNAKGLDYSRTGSTLCGSQAEHNSSTYTGGTTLR